MTDREPSEQQESLELDDESRREVPARWLRDEPDRAGQQDEGRTAGQFTGPDEGQPWDTRSAESAELAGAERDSGAEEQAVHVEGEESASGRTSYQQSSR